jgi:hypothetical protein
MRLETRVCLHVKCPLLLAIFRKVGICDLHAVCEFVNQPHPINFRMLEPIFMKLGMYITAPEPISTAYFINPSHHSVCLYVYPSVRC